LSAYYNEIEPYAAQWLRNLIKEGLIADGEVDTRSIVDVQPVDLRGFTQCHFFAGIGGWSHAFRLAGWPDDRPVWTGSCPCQPFSVAGKGAGTDDPRHLWPHFHRLISAVRPPVVLGEQVAGAAGYGWLDGVCADLEREGYASRGADLPALAVNAPHIRQRLYWVAVDKLANANDARFQGTERRRSAGAEGEPAGHPSERDSSHMADAGLFGSTRDEQQPEGSFQFGEGFWDDHVWLTGSDGKARRSKSGLPLLAHGVSNRVGRLRAYGNAICAPLAAEVIKAFMETEI